VVRHVPCSRAAAQGKRAAFGASDNWRKKMMGFLHLLRRRCRVLALLVLPAGVSSAAPLVPDRNDFFPIGVWQQPTYSFNKWKGRGINTLMEVPQGHDIGTWSDAAVSLGLYMLREPDDGTKLEKPGAVAAARRTDLEKYRSNLLAWTLPDEADFKKYSVKRMRTEYLSLKSVDTESPPTVMMNFSGGTVLGAGTRDGSAIPDGRYRRYMESIDWVSNDIYPVTGWGRSDWIDYSKSAKDRKTPGLVTDKLRRLGGDKPQLAIIETSDQNLSWVPGDHGVDAAQFRGQLWHSIIHGAQGIVYFPFQFTDRFTFDATPADVAEEMIVQHARIQRLASVINAPRDPKVLGFDPGNKKAARLLEVTWRRGRGADYFFVLNMSSASLDMPFDLTGVDGSGVIHGEDRTLRLNGKGMYRDHFEPWEMHVYKFAHPPDGQKRSRPLSLMSVTVPEPGAACAALCFARLLLLRRARRVGTEHTACTRSLRG
jgi:hypothetical protein